MSAKTIAAAAPARGLNDRTFPQAAAAVRSRGLVLGAGGLVLALVIGMASPAVFFPAYLAAYLFFLGFGLGSLGLLMIHHLTGGYWGYLIRRPLEAAVATLPLMAVLFLPLLLGMKVLYPWTDPAFVEAHAAVAAKAKYLNLNFWLVRAAVFHLVWSGMAWFFRSNSLAQDGTTDPAPTARSQSLSAPGLIVLFLTVTFAMTDWAMSTEPEWYSTIYPVMIFTGMGLSALALATAVSSDLRGVPPLADLADPDGFHDLGNLLLAFTMLWAYMSFSQYLIIWMGDLAEEIPWYVERSAGAWRVVIVSLIVIHFFAPFFLLLMRDNKRDPARLRGVAILLIAMQLINDVWLIVPGFTEGHSGSRTMTAMTLLCLVPAVAALGGLWASFYARALASRPIAPRHDPVLEQSLAHGGGH